MTSHVTWISGRQLVVREERLVTADLDSSVYYLSEGNGKKQNCVDDLK